MTLPALSELLETFTLLPGWEERYAYLIDLGRALPPMPEAMKSDAVLVPGCTARVWLVAEEKGGHSGEGRGDSVFHFHVDSDAAIVKGLCAVLMVCVQDQSAAAIRAVDMKQIFEQLGLSAHLSPNRRNGFFAMVARIKLLAGG